MSGTCLIIRHLCFTGPNKSVASLEFGPGLNVIYGASETGKSFVLEAIDFMFGSGKELRDIPERVGYDQVWLGVEATDGQEFTLQRSTGGGKFSLYRGLHFTAPEGVRPKSLSARHNPTNDDNVSTYLLRKIGLADKRVKKNARGETNSLSFRYLSHLCLIGEGSIQKEGSPIETGQFTTRTAELSVFKLLLTGVDDSTLQPEARSEKEKLTQSAKIEVIEELVSDYKQRLTSLVGDETDPTELTEQLKKIDESLEHEQLTLQQKEKNYREILRRKNDFRRKLELAENRLNEVKELIARFKLLDQQYQSDLDRLESIREAGSLVSVLEVESCPLCGAIPTEQHLAEDCDGNVENVIIAAKAESEKIKRLQYELAETVKQLKSEENQFEGHIPEIENEFNKETNNLRETSPELSEQRSSYSDYLEKRNTVQNALNVVSSIVELEQRRLDVEETPAKKESNVSELPGSELSASTLDKFSKHYEELLKTWHFPEADRVHFETASKDFIISGKPRGSRGKGMRALSHAAFTIALQSYTESHDLLHPGFSVLDTPLLAYREPEGEEDDLSGTDVKDQFYDHLQKWTSRQVIILENDDPTDSVINDSQTVFFSKNPHQGRYGFFPLVE